MEKFQLKGGLHWAVWGCCLNESHPFPPLSSNAHGRKVSHEQGCICVLDELWNRLHWVASQQEERNVELVHLRHKLLEAA